MGGLVRRLVVQSGFPSRIPIDIEPWTKRPSIPFSADSGTAPGAWTTFRGERLKLGPVGVTADAGPVSPTGVLSLAPGELYVTKQAVYAGTATSAVRLGLVRPHGKKEMAAADWARGVRITAGERLGLHGLSLIHISEPTRPY